jgi:uncharacterized protein
MREILLSALGAAFTVWAILVAGMSLFQSSFIFFPSREIIATPTQAGLVYEPIEVRAEDGVRLSGWHVPAAEARLTVLFLHGNAGNISHRLMALHALHGLGLAVLILDYRGYGESSGSPSEQGTYRDALAAWEYLTRTLGIAADRIVLFGESLGGAVATWLATREHPAGLIWNRASRPCASWPAMSIHSFPRDGCYASITRRSSVSPGCAVPCS